MPQAIVRLLLAIVSAAVVVACGAGSDSEVRRVLVAGDSITGLVADDFATRDEADIDFTLRATNGATSAEIAAMVREEASLSFDQVIVNVGTNDALRDRPIGETEDAVRQIVDDFETASCVHLTTVNEGAISFVDPEIPERMEAVNDKLAAVAEERDRVSLISWSEEIDAYEKQGKPDGGLLVDTIHPTGVGQDRLMDLYLDALHDC